MSFMHMCVYVSFDGQPKSSSRLTTIRTNPIPITDNTAGKPWDPFGFAGISERNTLGINPHLKWLQESEVCVVMHALPL